jgi:hypothetical protein
METLITILLPLIVITYIVIDAMTVRKQRKNAKLKTESLLLSLKTIDPILNLTEENAGERKNENDYIEIGKQILNNPSFFDLNRDAINAIYNNEEEG